MKIIAAKRVLWAICLLSVYSNAMSHELDDGFIERAVQVRIRGDQLSIEYAIGLTETTMTQIIESVEDPAVGVESATDAVESDIRAEFKKFTREALTKSLVLTVDGKKQPLTVESITDYPRHHYDFVINVNCQLDVTGQAELKLKDGNFSKWEGAARYALKSTGGTMIARSDTSPIIVRAKRHELSTLKPDERHNACQINATIACFKSGPKD